MFSFVVENKCLRLFLSGLPGNLHSDPRQAFLFIDDIRNGLTEEEILRLAIEKAGENSLFNSLCRVYNRTSSCAGRKYLLMGHGRKMLFAVP